MSRRLRIIVSAGAIALLLQLAILFLVFPRISSDIAESYNQGRSMDGYDLIAANLVAGDGYRLYPDTARTLMREPGYPLFLAGLQVVFGRSFAVVKLANLVLALMTGGLMLTFGSRLLPELFAFDSSMVVLAPLLFLFHPGVLIAEVREGVEVLFALLVTMFLLAVNRAIEKGNWENYAVCGFVLGLTVLVKSTPMLFPVLLLAYLLLGGAQGSKVSKIRNTGVMVVAMVTVLSPWIIRNYAITGKIVPTASVLGVSAQAGQYIGEHLFEGTPWWLLDRAAGRERDRLAQESGLPFKEDGGYYYQPFYKSIDELTFSKELLGRVVSEYRRSPLLFVRCVGQNLIAFWFAGKTWLATGLNFAIQLPYLLLAVVGAVHCFRIGKGSVVGPAILFICYTMAVHAPILAQARYSVSLLPIISVLAVVGLAPVWVRAPKSKALRIDLARPQRG